MEISSRTATRQARLEAAGEHREDLLAERGWALVDARKTAEADTVFERAAQGIPTRPSRHRCPVQSRRIGQPGRQPRGGRPLADSAGISRKARTESRLMPLVLYRLGRTQIELGDWAAAEATLDRLIGEFPGSPRNREARLLRAEAALRRDHPADAEAILSALEAEPVRSGGSRGLCQDDPGKAYPEPAGREAVEGRSGPSRRARSRNYRPKIPRSPSWTSLAARALLGLARPEEARAAFQSVITARKGGDLAAQAHLMRGETYFHQERYHEALTEFLKVDILYDVPRWQAAALLEAGKVYERLAQWGDAAETYERLCSRFPKDPRVTEAKERLEAARKHGSARVEPGGKVL